MSQSPYDRYAKFLDHCRCLEIEAEVRAGTYMPKVLVSSDGRSPEDAMRDEESCGVALDALPVTDKVRLGILWEGKRQFDITVKAWKSGIASGLFQAEEFFESLDLDISLFHSIFGRNPDIRVIRAWAIQGAHDSQNQTIATLEKRILELESANAVEREKIRDEALVEAAEARCIYCRSEDWSDAELHGDALGLSYYIHQRKKGHEKYYHVECNSGPIHRLRRPQ